MDTVTWLDAVRENTALFVAAARKAGLDAPVPTCPEWTVTDLATHQGTVYGWMSTLVETRSETFIKPQSTGQPAEGEDPVDWLEERAERALKVLGAADPQIPVWNWFARGPAPAVFWYRRMAHETVVHRTDAEAAAGQGAESRVDPPELASDGIDEFLHLLPALGSRDDRFASMAGSYHFHTTDVPGEWVVELADGTIAIRREHAKADCAVRGPASDLMLFLVGRRGPEGLEVLGDEAMVPTLTANLRF